MLGRSRTCLLTGPPCDERSKGAATAGETRRSEAATSLFLSFTETHAPRDTSTPSEADGLRADRGLVLHYDFPHPGDLAVAVLRKEQQLDGHDDGHDDHQRSDDLGAIADAGAGTDIAADNLAERHHNGDGPDDVALGDEEHKRCQI